MTKKSLKQHLVEGPITYDFTTKRGSKTTLHDFGGLMGRWSLDTHSLLGSHIL